MRILVIALLLALISPAEAGGWDHYLNDRFGYSLDIPPDFIGASETDNGDGRVYTSTGKTQKLTVWGGFDNFVEGQGFADEVAGGLAADQQRGWKISYQTSTPGWASYSGSKGPRILYVRLVSACKGEQYAEFQLEYPAADIAKMNPVIDRLVHSFKPGANCD